MSNQTVKKARQLARSLPPVYVFKKRTIVVTGKELLKKQHKDKDGFDIIPDKNYTLTSKIMIEADHAKRIAEVYELQGERGVAKYMIWARRTHNNQQQQIKNKAMQQPVKKTAWQYINNILKSFKIFVWNRTKA